MSEDGDDRDAESGDDVEALAEEDPAAAFEEVENLPGTHLRAMEFWDDVVADMEATAAGYEDDGWETVQLHPGDVTVLTPDPESGDDRFGLDVLVPDDEFEAVEERMEEGVSFDAYEVFSAAADDLALLVVAMEDRDAEFAVLYPAYYDVQSAQRMLELARSEGELYSYVRTLSEERIEFVHDDPSVFAPPGEDGDGDGERA
ncbi:MULTISPECIES: DUF7529 family protein [Halorussus]|uniref:DUF7529 family protein n=1 Tax=Halorussus TaxID=1070314 RepID=UPI00209CD38B|nr:hypothetical protein [Halorussus vallis]USZ74538.1 hypothetical protein NGM07_13930 [Halorussus vallis]